ncbi:hypothetical protein [Amycolatopsis sp. NPDC051071]|uniref:hypothetical protein n=1 Tax=Amycolatopsis sp. NPDC051071 TaxID=3154637 RepID=UPI003415CAD1
MFSSSSRSIDNGGDLFLLLRGASLLRRDLAPARGFLLFGGRAAYDTALAAKEQNSCANSHRSG